MTGVSDTSVEAFCSINGNGTVLNQTGEVYKVILKSEYPLTRSEISERSGVKLNAVCGRVNELMKAGFIVQQNKRICSITGYGAYTLVTNPTGNNNE